MRGRSDSPLEVEVNPRSGLRSGFPIKIAGHAIGSGTGEGGPSHVNLFSDRLRSRRSSESCYERSRMDTSQGSEALQGTRGQSARLLGERNERRKSIGGLPYRQNPSHLIPRKTDIILTRPGVTPQKYTQSALPSDCGHRLREENTILKVDQSQPGNISNIPQNIFEVSLVNNDRNMEDGEGKNNFSVNEDSSSMIENNFCDQSDLFSNSRTFDIDAAITKMSEELKAFEGLSKENNSSEEVADSDCEKEMVEDNSLDDVITKMKNSLKAIKDGMSVTALVDLNREFTPLDLPPLR